MKELVTLWVNVLVRATTVVVQYSQELYNVTTAQYFTLAGVSSPNEMEEFGKDV